MTDRAADADEFAAFVRANSRQLQRAAWLLTGNWGTAEDLVQTALTRTWQRWAAIRAPEVRLPYVRRTLLTTFVSDRRRHRVVEVSLGAAPDAAVGADPAVDIAQRAVVLAALERLPRLQRAVVVLRYFDDLTELAAADALGCSVGTVKSSASRAFEKLRLDPHLSAALTEGRG